MHIMIREDLGVIVVIGNILSDNFGSNWSATDNDLSRPVRDADLPTATWRGPNSQSIFSR